jgi:2'-5' RNA ligase
MNLGLQWQDGRMIRAFIALTPPLMLQQAFREVGTALQGLPVRWVQPEQVHLTLKFLGNVPAEQITSIRQALEHTVRERAPFTVCARSLGCFPNASRPRILWMGLDDPQQALSGLQQQVEAALSALGFAPEARPFHPHLTLARFQEGRRVSRLLSLLPAYQDRVFGDMPVAQMHLFQSQLRREGALYTILHSVRLPR